MYDAMKKEEQARKVFSGSNIGKKPRLDQLLQGSRVYYTPRSALESQKLRVSR